MPGKSDSEMCRDGSGTPPLQPKQPVAERAQSVGVRLGFLDHAKSGIPMTLLSLALAVGWLWAVGEMGV